MRETIKRSNPSWVNCIEFMQMDLSDLNSVKDFANEMNNRYEKVDILLNNAGIINTSLQTTA